MSNAVHGYGAQLQVDDGAGNYTTIAEVKSISGPRIQGNVVDVTNMSSSGGWREKIVTLLDGGQVTFEINFVPTGATHNGTAGMLYLMKNRTLRAWKLILPDIGGTTWSFSGYVSGTDLSVPLEGVLTGSITVTVTGAPTIP